MLLVAPDMFSPMRLELHGSASIGRCGSTGAGMGAIAWARGGPAEAAEAKSRRFPLDRFCFLFFSPVGFVCWFCWVGWFGLVGLVWFGLVGWVWFGWFGWNGGIWVLQPMYQGTKQLANKPIYALVWMGFMAHLLGNKTKCQQA